MLKEIVAVPRTPHRRLRTTSGLCVLGLAGLVLTALADTGSAEESASFRLVFVGEFDVYDKDAGFLEPSGLAFDTTDNALWSVSDDTGSVFRLKLDGSVEEEIAVDGKDLEGVALLESTGKLLAVQEGGNEILVIDVERRELISKLSLGELRGYSSIAHLLGATPANKGLEGITVDPKSGSVYVAIEGRPRLLVWVSADLEAVEGFRLLTAEDGFVSDVADDEELDVSGLSFDPRDGRLWIVSQKGKRVFRYDVEERVVESAELTFEVEGESHRIKGAEGITIDPRIGRLYFVTDRGKRSRLLVFDVDEGN